MDAHERAANARLAEFSADQIGEVRGAYARLELLAQVGAGAGGAGAGVL
jgi:hypothetical protein